MCNLGLSLWWGWGPWLWTDRAELMLQGEALAQGHRVTSKTGLRFSPTIVQALPSHCPAHPPLSFLGSQRIRTSGVVLLETILFGSLLLYFPVSLWPETGPI